jgi:hypothetical protein
MQQPHAFCLRGERRGKNTPSLLKCIWRLVGRDGPAKRAQARRRGCTTVWRARMSYCLSPILVVFLAAGAREPWHGVCCSQSSGGQLNLVLMSTSSLQASEEEEKAGSGAAHPRRRAGGQSQGDGILREIHDEVVALFRWQATLGDLQAKLNTASEADEPKAARGVDGGAALKARRAGAAGPFSMARRRPPRVVGPFLGWHNRRQREENGWRHRPGAKDALHLAASAAWRRNAGGRPPRWACLGPSIFGGAGSSRYATPSAT